jgi:8-oxo-dGTP diphosphatase
VTQSPAAVSGSSISTITQAAVGVIVHADGRVLLAERPAGKPWAGYWEFPGGKIEANETPQQALLRELQEELGISVTLAYPWLTRTFDYAAKYDDAGRLEVAAKTVKLHFFMVQAWVGEPSGLEQQLLSWQDVEALTVSPMLPANFPLFTSLSLAPVYAISNLSELGPSLFFERLAMALQNGLRMIQLREKQLSAADFIIFSRRVMAMARPFNAKVLLNSTAVTADLSLPVQLGAAGIHFTAHDLMQLQVRPRAMLCGASCHDREQLAHAAKLGLDYVLLSPVQATLSHVGAEPMGWAAFSDLIAGYSLPVYALGGMGVDDMHLARSHGAHGIALQRNIWH